MAMPGRSSLALAGYAERAASPAVRLRDADYLHAGLTAAAIAYYLADDWRDVVLVMAPLSRACELLGRGPAVEFGARGTRDRSLAVMGYVEGADDGRFRFVRTW
ncbi:hypothetical protein ACFQV2_22570 [Actinokineospora soli]|uniref:Uncharacterized protein n=1 Tax=Actinokineospora soli TaxID=1048753 RepID=A0ABW2TRQ7_9PSEU